MIRLVIADDHAVLRQGLISLLKECTDIDIVGDVADGDAALALVKAERPDVIVLDISMPGPGIIRLLKEFDEHVPDMKSLILSTHAEDQYAVRALRAGADGYLTKERSGDELATAVRHVASGRKFISPELAEHLASSLGDRQHETPHERLSDREFQVFVRLGRGLRANDVAAELHVSPKTVHTYRSRIFEKTGLKSDAEIVHYAVRNGLLD